MLPKWPRSMRMLDMARQVPSVGSALNWQGQPQAQLQLTYSGPSMLQSTKTIVTSLVFNRLYRMLKKAV